MLKKTIIVALVALGLSAFSWKTMDNEGYWRDTNLFNVLFTPVDASYRPTIIKRIQEGTVSLGLGTTSSTATLSNAVVLANSYVQHLGTTSNYTGNNLTHYGTIALTNTTTVTGVRGSAEEAGSIRFMVVEYYSGVLRSSQQVAISYSDADESATISSVNTAKTVLINNGWMHTASGGDGYMVARAELTNATTVTSRRGVGGFSTMTHRIAVVEYR